MERFKNKVESTDLTFEAAKRRIADRDNEKLDPKTLERLATQLLRFGNTSVRPRLSPGDPLNSTSFRNALKDGKFIINLMNLRAQDLSSQIKRTVQESFGTLNDIQQEAASLDASVREEEIRVYGAYTVVHHNQFTRSKDLQVSIEDTSWFQDPKTGLPLLPENLARIVPGTGVTLPTKYITAVRAVDCFLVSDQTDFGDSVKPLVSSSPRNLLLPNRIFRHVIARKEFDNNGFRLGRDHAYCTVMVQLGGPQLVNQLSIKPVSQVPIEIDQISYVDQEGALVPIPALTLQQGGSTLLLFEPVRTQWLQVKLKQSAAASKSHIVIQDSAVTATNKVLEGIGFTTLLPDTTEEIQGWVHDFSLESLELSLIQYGALGVFRSLPIRVERMLGFSVVRDSKVLEGSSEFGIGFDLDPTVSRHECYVGISLKGIQGNQALRELVPVPDRLGTQKEILPIAGHYVRVKLFPEIRGLIQGKVFVKSAVVASSVLTVTTDGNHNLLVDDRFQVVGPVTHRLNGTFKVASVLGLDQFTVAVSNPAFDVEEAQLPKTFLFLASEQDPPLRVWGNDEELELGLDFEISLDRGSSFLSVWPFDGDYNELYRDARSGNFLVRILKPTADKIYWIEYTHDQNQWLGSSSKVWLESGRVLFDQSLAETSGELTAVWVTRSDSPSPYTTPVLASYSVRVRESVS